jgi:hypothetical protein
VKAPPLLAFERLADCKSAIRQSATLRYILGAILPKYMTDNKPGLACNKAQSP